ncbi:MAG: rhomboid family intramembrane serine protease [Gammaproteobacteria bacterium]|nr:rhomboid family intramembrane serine protease [Gammaproteobacteria bacterium]
MPDISELLKSMTNRLVLANVVVYIVLQALFADANNGLELYYWQHPEFRPWQIISYMFLHAGLTHLLFNMIALWSFGRMLERVWGAQRMLIFFLVCGVGAALVHEAYSYFQFQQITEILRNAGFSATQVQRLYVDGVGLSPQAMGVSLETQRELYAVYNTPAVGASGAVYGILVAFALLFPDFKIMLIFLPVPIAARYFVPVLLLIDLSAGVTGVSLFGYNIAHFAHLGGALAGFLLVNYWARTRA